MGIVNWALLAHHISSQLEIVLFILAVSVSLFFGLLTWLLYVALEPYVRRYWPDTLISWSRFLAGKFQDPVVARDVLLGTLFGLASAALEQLQPYAEAWLGRAPQRPLGLTTAYTLEGFRGSIATVLSQASSSFSGAFIIFFFFFLLRFILRRNWLAAVVMSLLFCIPSLAAQNPLIDALFTAPFFLAYLYILHRFGLVTLTVLYFVDQLADSMPLATSAGCVVHRGRFGGDDHDSGRGVLRILRITRGKARVRNGSIGFVTKSPGRAATKNPKPAISRLASSARLLR